MSAYYLKPMKHYRIEIRFNDGEAWGAEWLNETSLRKVRKVLREHIKDYPSMERRVVQVLETVVKVDLKRRKQPKPSNTIAHNPDNLTAEQIEVSRGWRLLDA